MSLLREQHRQAMDLADKAFTARRLGDDGGAVALFRQAFECERQAAEAAALDSAAEPTRSVLCRSAATLALDCGEVREAERLIAVGLSGNPPFEIAEELRDLLEQVYSHRHLHQMRPVGRTAPKDGTKQQVTLKRAPDEAPAASETRRTRQPGERVSVTGELQYADARGGARGKIGIIDRQGKEHRVTVPEGMMGDIVRPLWEDDVVVTGWKTKRDILLEDIKRVSES